MEAGFEAEPPEPDPVTAAPDAPLLADPPLPEACPAVPERGERAGLGVGVGVGVGATE